MSYTRKALATRGRILDRAAELIFGKGFSRTKLDEILLAANVQKGNFYYYFASKDDLGLAVLRERGRHLVVDYFKSLLDPRQDAKTNLASLGDKIARAAEVANGKMNPVTKLAFELGDTSELFRQELQSIMDDVVGILASEIERLQKQGGLAQNSNPQELAAFLFSVIEGSILRYKATRNPEHIKRTIKLGLGVLNGM